MARLTRASILAAISLSTSLPLFACHSHGSAHPGAEVVVAPQRGGPPAHAPAHGYRRKHQGAHGDLELVFDSGLGVYVVIGFPDLYFHADHFFRWSASGWQVSLQADSGFVLAAQSDVPAGLRDKNPGKPHGKSKQGGPPGPAKKR